jgi:phosphate transport system substrate-binding protein
MAQNTGRQGVSRRKFLVASGSVGAAALAGCSENPQSSDGNGGNDGGNGGGETTTDGGGGSLTGEIKIAGSSTVFPLATQMKQAFQTDHPDVDISIQSTGSGGGFSNHFCPGRTDFNNASRPITEEEQQQCADNDVEPVELKVATDALTVIVNPDANWVDCVTVDELRQIWSGEDQPELWSDVNSDWPDEELNLFGPTEASGTYDYFIEAVLGEDGPGHRQDYQATEQDRTIINGVSRNQYALGYMGFAYYSENKDQVKALAVDDGDGCTEPTLDTAKSGAYTPLARPLFTYVKQSALSRDEVHEFATFWLENATSTELVAEKVGYVPLGDDEKQAQLETLQNAIDSVN